MTSPQGTQPLPASAQEDLTEDLVRSPLGILLAHQEDVLQVAALGKAVVEGQEVDQVRVEVSGVAFTLGLDPESGCLATTAHRDRDITGAPGEIVTVYSEYRDVGGLRLPHLEVSTFQGEPKATFTIESFTFLEELSEELFQAPSP